MADGPLRVAWPLDQELAGNAFGWSRANRALRGYMEKAGAIIDPEAPLVLHFCSPQMFRPVDGKVNVLYSMAENGWLPKSYYDAFSLPDAIVTPSEWNAEVFRQYTDTPVYVAPLGVHLDTRARPEDPIDPEQPGLMGITRSRPHGRKFRWLWIGAWNERKGIREVEQAWRTGGFFAAPAKCELYLKTTVDPIREQGQPARVAHAGNIIRDSRIITDRAMLDLYAAADAFVFPSWGEGWGLPLLEAMATALPCVAPLHSGMTAFADQSTIFPVKYNLILGGAVLARDEAAVRVVPHYEPTPVPDVRDLVETMQWVMLHWKQAQRQGRRAWQRAQGFGWEAAGRRLYDVLFAVWSGGGGADAISDEPPGHSGEDGDAGGH